MPAWSESAVNKLLVRYADLVPSRTGNGQASVPAGIVDDDFIIIGCAETGQAHIAAPHGFDVVGVRQALGSVRTAHCCSGAEVLIAHSGRWRLTIGPNAEDGSIELEPGAVASVPAGKYRCVDMLDDGSGFMFAVRSTTETSEAPWAPAVFESAAGAGLRPRVSGPWIDDSGGALLLREVSAQGEGDAAMPVAGALADCVIAAAAIAPNAASALAAEGVDEAGVVVPCATRDGFNAGPVRGWWRHGFNLRLLTLQSGAYVPAHIRQESEVFLVHEGTLEVRWDGGAIMLGAGDTLSVPTGLPRALRNTTSRCCRSFVVRGSEDPAPPLFQSRPIHG